MFFNKNLNRPKQFLQEEVSDLLKDLYQKFRSISVETQKEKIFNVTIYRIYSLTFIKTKDLFYGWKLKDLF